MVPYSVLIDSSSNQNSRIIEVVESRLHEIIRAALGAVEVDETWYIKVNNDVRAAIRSGLFKSAKDHYIAAGYFEGRLPRPATVDETWYSKEYLDVAEAIRAGKFASGQEHFSNAGFREGRLPRPGWSILSDSSRTRSV